ncbi:hypothetical protein CF68_09990 [Cupriavidus sp. SK-4]|nr:hypothetical protein CF68_09990 [Cupriavidus sp. SK-4]
MPNEILQFSSQSSQILQSFLHKTELLLGQCAGCAARAAIALSQQYSDFIQGEPERLGLANEMKPLQALLRILANGAIGTLRHRQQAAPVVVAYRLHANASRLGQLPDC